ncbi:MAG: SPOR domain-containing protein, partial [Magnetococcales bacterium]|nr:SPOR domain-containing protein [Magnetococcales bacterium]
MIKLEKHGSRPPCKPGSWGLSLLVVFAMLILPGLGSAASTSSNHLHVWIYPLEEADSGKVDETQSARVLNAIQQALGRLQGFQKMDLGAPAYVLPAGAPDPRTVLGASQLARLGAHYVVGHTLIAGQSGFLALELYHPPQPRMVWMAIHPLTADTDIRQVTSQLALQLAEHLQRLDARPLIALAPLSALQAVAAAPASAGQSAPSDLPKDDRRYALQVEASLIPDHAYNAIKSLRALGYEPRMEVANDAENHKWHYVRLGTYPDRNSAQSALQSFQEKEKIPAVLVMTTSDQKSEPVPGQYLVARNKDKLA